MSAYFVDLNVIADVNVANVNIVPVALNHATLPYNNIMSASWRESTGQSVEPSNVTGIDNPPRSLSLHIGNSWDDNNQLIVCFQTNNILWRELFVYRLQHRRTMRTVSGYNVLIN